MKSIQEAKEALEKVQQALEEDTEPDESLLSALDQAIERYETVGG
jgi:hypothetical protein